MLTLDAQYIKIVFEFLVFAVMEMLRLTASFRGESIVDCCAVAPDGITIVAGEASGRIHFVRLENVS